MKCLERGVFSLGDEGRNYGGVVKFKWGISDLIPKHLGGVTLLIESKLTPQNGCCAQDAAGIGVADQCRHLLICFAMCPRLAPAASFSWPYNLIVLLYLFLQLLRRHGGTALFKSMAEQLCWRQNLGLPLKNDPRMAKIGGWGHLMVQINPPLPNPSFPYESIWMYVHLRLQLSRIDVSTQV